MKVCILDYGSGNVKSVFNMISTLTDDVTISNNTSDIKNASHLILPGVGAFGASMKKINENIPVDELANEVLNTKKPFLGICVGMQVLAEKGLEFGEHKGFGWINGTVEKLSVPENLSLPHIGWNDINIKKQNNILLNHFTDHQDFYFVHSFAISGTDDEYIVSDTEYGTNFISVVNKENIFGVQFHPEKSQKAGKVLIENFLNIK